MSLARAHAAAAVLLWLAMTFTGSAHAETLALETSKEVVTSASVNQTVRLTFDAPATPDQTTVSLFTTAHESVPVGPLRSSGDPTSLLLDLPNLTPGVYSLIWQSATASSGSLAFVYDPAQQSPQIVVQPQPQFTLPPLDRVIPRWLVYARSEGHTSE